MSRLPGFAAPNPLTTGPGERIGKIDDQKRLASLVAMPVDPSLASESYCYLTTTGRVSGEPREIEIWFGLDGDTLYMLAGGRERSDWVKNLIRQPEVKVRLGDRIFEGRARIVSSGDEDARARHLLLEKYSRGYGGDLSEWGETALPVAVDLG
jgi:deazaflavin-dependent oxidoreductase (nitroreductase family)